MWKKLGSKIAYHSPYFSVEESEVVKPDGSKGIYYTVVTRKGVAVIVYDGKKVLLVNQYRVPLEKKIWSFVAGGADHEDILEDAKRELKEETGFTAERWTRLESFPLSPSTTNQVSNLFLAENLQGGDPEREGGEEDMESRFFSFDEVDELISKNEFSAFDIADFYLFKKYLEKNK